MAHPLIPILAIVYGMSSTATIDLNAQSKDPISLAKGNSGMIIIAADQYPDGDPHGDDPHDEHHDRPFDKRLPQRDHRDDHKPSQDPYNGDYPNDKKPY